MMHLRAFIRIFNVAFQCIWYKLHSCAFVCILCRMHSHSLLHSRAFNPQDAFMCILDMMHSLHVAFKRMLMHSQLDAFSNLLHLVHVIHSCRMKARPWTRSRPCPPSRRRSTPTCATRTAQSRPPPSASSRPRWAARPSTPRSFPSWAGSS